MAQVDAVADQGLWVPGIGRFSQTDAEAEQWFGIPTSFGDRVCAQNPDHWSCKEGLAQTDAEDVRRTGWFAQANAEAEFINAAVIACFNKSTRTKEGCGEDFCRPFPGKYGCPGLAQVEAEAEE